MANNTLQERNGNSVEDSQSSPVPKENIFLFIPNLIGIQDDPTLEKIRY